ncbi:ABC transporter substrate-binding protein [Paramicrobacterium agarici]|uniref:ABC transporter substrate-binding protein n=1 Tax=Paramicrobacterium agarici TaxID=630514 RepID=UPI0011539A64|nr:ABC transporter substrate-binding protein [Microbacterium agarici]TQO23181.1 peptide/nickel transport system substrate-binding protein [Microbacterium agarici]
MPRHSPLAALALGAAAMMCLTSCAAAASSAEQQADGGTLVYAHQQEPPCVFGGWIEQAYLSYQVLDSLTSLDENGNAVAWLAESWTVSDDGLDWTFRLKHGVTFTDGSELTASVIAYNVEYWMAGGNSTAKVWLDGYYSSAEAIDEHTLALHLDKPYPRLPETLAQGYFGIQSQEALETRSDEQNCEQPIGSGAFTVAEWNRGQNIVLERNDDYTSWPANAQHEGPALVKTVDWRFVPDGATRASALKSEEVDAIYDVPSVEWETLEQGGFGLYKYVTPGRPQQLAFNTAQGPFTDERVRKAFAYSLDREALVETIGLGVIPYEGNGAVSQATPGYSQQAAERYSYDPEKANDLLDAAGWGETNADGFRVKDGQVLEVTLPYGAGTIINAEGASILQGVAEQAKQVGFDVTLIPVPPSEHFAGAYTQRDERDVAAGYWTSVTAGILWINWRADTEEAPNGNNAAFYNSPELEDLILRANSATDIAEQNELYQLAQEYIAEHALSIGLYDRLSTLAVSPRVAGIWQEHSQGGPVFHDAHFVA